MSPDDPINAPKITIGRNPTLSLNIVAAMHIENNTPIFTEPIHAEKMNLNIDII